MKKLASFCFTIVATFAWQPSAFAQADQAQAAAVSILNNLGSQKYNLVWDQQTSGWFKKQIGQKDAFIANMSMGRQAFGKLTKSSLVSQDHSTRDPASGYVGDIYAFTFRDSYQVGEFFERVVVLKDTDGAYRLAGLFGSPVPRN